MDTFITYFFTYVELSMLAVAILLSAISFIARHKQISTLESGNIGIMYMLLFCAGLSFLWQAVFYATLPQTAAIAQGYLPSPFEWQISAAYVGIAVIALIGAFSSTRFRLAAILLATAVMWGQATAKLYLGAMGQIDHVMLDYLNMGAQIITPFLLIAFYRMSRPKSTQNQPSAATA